MEVPPLGPAGEDITWPDQVAPRGRKASSTRKIKPQTSNQTTPAKRDVIMHRASTRCALPFAEIEAGGVSYSIYPLELCQIPAWVAILPDGASKTDMLLA